MRQRRWIVGGLVIAALVCATIPFPHHWLATGAIVTTLILTRLENQRFLRSLRIARASDVVLYLLAFAPWVAADLGDGKARSIREGVEYVYAASDVPGLSSGVEVAERPRLLGHAGEHTFFYLPKAHSVAIVEKDNLKTLVLSKQTKRSTPAPAPAPATATAPASKK